MSMETTIVYGYGFTPKYDHLAEFFKNHINTIPEQIKDNLMEDVEKMSGEEIEEMYADYDQGYGDSGIYSLVADIMVEETGIHFQYASDSEGPNSAILCPERMPWGLNEKEKSLTEESLRQIIEPYAKELGVDGIDYCSIEYYG